jgi:phosphoribosylformylglycinamidine synthase PurS subunit
VNEYQLEVRITPREGLLDPEGKAVEHALHSLEFQAADHVRVGKLIRLRLRATDDDAAREQADAMCRQLLANPVTEDYTINLDRA